MSKKINWFVTKNEIYQVEKYSLKNSTAASYQTMVHCPNMKGPIIEIKMFSGYTQRYTYTGKNCSNSTYFDFYDNKFKIVW